MKNCEKQRFSPLPNLLLKVAHGSPEDPGSFVFQFFLSWLLFLDLTARDQSFGSIIGFTNTVDHCFEDVSFVFVFSFLWGGCWKSHFPPELPTDDQSPLTMRKLSRKKKNERQMALKKPGITVRTMPSFLRFGSVQLAAKRASGLGRWLPFRALLVKNQRWLGDLRFSDVSFSFHLSCFFFFLGGEGLSFFAPTRAKGGWEMKTVGWGWEDGADGIWGKKERKIAVSLSNVCVFSVWCGGGVIVAVCRDLFWRKCMAAAHLKTPKRSQEELLPQHERCLNNIK